MSCSRPQWCYNKRKTSEQLSRWWRTPALERNLQVSLQPRSQIISFPAAQRIQTAGLPVCALFISLKCALFTSNHIPWPVSEYLRREREDVLAASPLGRTSVEGCGTYACCSIINELLSPQHTLCLLPKDDNVRTASCIWMVLCAAAVPVPVAYTGWFLGGNLSLYWYNKNRLKNSYLFYSAQG